jgi:AcrR family transcriptional regulator
VTRPAEKVDSRRTDTGERIRATAVDLFTSQGFEMTTLAQVADQLGITRQAVYHHFRSKEAVLTSSYAELTPRVTAVLADLTAEPGEREAAFARTVELFAGPFAPVLVCTYINEHALRGSAEAVELLDRLKQLAMQLAPTSDVDGRMRGLLALDALTLAVAPLQLGGTQRQRTEAAHTLARALLFDVRAEA